VQTESPDLVIAKLLLDHLKLRASSSSGQRQAWMARWWETGCPVTGWRRSTSRDSAATASPGASGHHRAWRGLTSVVGATIAPGRFRTAPEIAKVERRTREQPLDAWPAEKHSLTFRMLHDGDRTLAIASTLELLGNRRISIRVTADATT
jgi:hypothetical protein